MVEAQGQGYTVELLFVVDKRAFDTYVGRLVDEWTDGGLLGRIG